MLIFDEDCEAVWLVEEKVGDRLELPVAEILVEFDAAADGVVL